MQNCGSCRYWCRHPANPMNLGGPALGECRAIPPGQVVLPTARQELQIVSRYPVTHEKFPACGQYTPVLVEVPAGE